MKKDKQNPLELVEEKRVQELEKEGLTHGDAVAVAMAEIISNKQ